MTWRLTLWQSPSLACFGRTVSVSQGFVQNCECLWCWMLILEVYHRKIYTFAPRLPFIMGGVSCNHGWGRIMYVTLELKFKRDRKSGCRDCYQAFRNLWYPPLLKPWSKLERSRLEAIQGAWKRYPFHFKFLFFFSSFSFRSGDHGSPGIEFEQG